MRRTAIRRQSPKQAAKQREWNRLKLAEIRRQIETFGSAHCKYARGEFGGEDACMAVFWTEEYAMDGLHADHKTLRSQGGENTAENLELLCPYHHLIVKHGQ